MSKKVYLIEDTLVLVSTDASTDKQSRHFFDLGNALCDFMRCEEDAIFHFYHDMAFDYAIYGAVPDVLSDGNDFVMVDSSEDLTRLSPYFHLYTSYFKSFSEALHTDRVTAYQKLIEVLGLPIKQIPSLNLEEANCKAFLEKFPPCEPLNDDAQKALPTYLFAALLISTGIKGKKQALLDELDFLCGTTQSSPSMDAMKRLYLLDYKRKGNGKSPYYLNLPIMVTYELDKTVPKNVNSVEDMALFLSNENVEIRGLTYIETVNELIRYELISIIKYGLHFKKCKYCGHYFIPRGRSDIEYCSRIKQGETKPCDQVGAIKRYQAEKSKDEIHVAFQKAYRRMNAKARTKRITQPEFFIWSEQTRKKRDDCQAGVLSFDEFKSWLDEDKRKPKP